MPITFDRNWNSRDNHQSGRSKIDVQRIVEEVAERSGLSTSPVATARALTVKKGIHEDRHGAHITVELGEPSFESYHIWLTQSSTTGDFYWRPCAVGKFNANLDPARMTYATGESAYHTRDRNYQKGQLFKGR